MAYEFRIEESSLCPPEAARYCCRMYCADEVSCVEHINTVTQL